MKLSCKHIHPFFYISILLIGFILYSGNPINALTNYDFQISNLQINADSFSDIEIAANDEQPDDDETDFQNAVYELTLKETEKDEDSSTGKSSLAILKQAASHSISYVEVPPSDVVTSFKHLKILLNKDTRLLEFGFLFSRSFNTSPYTSGIAINAP
ncbi:hypothetical protein [Rhodohalobacter sp.]|uniref:hypothetical protein n=1 Tax=Rhodohalobacter sp. TaxID=1974210 RepID=UPI002ACE7C8E|nr:hypothetical protein [Rhodohalobacter sp.]MDZ7757720.1 hypothetical protein [Rhodohalobacter sp.]